MTQSSEQAKEYLEAYAEYSRTIRTWFVAYGIGAPLLILTTKELARSLKTSGSMWVIAILFLVGVCFQVLLAAVNKATMWALYYGEIRPTFTSTKRYKWAHSYSEHLLIDLGVDVATMVVFAVATVWIFVIIVE